MGMARLVHRPIIRHYLPAPPAKLETDLKTLADAANEATKREAAQWFYFVTIMITLAAIVGSTTHRVLFLEEAVKVPLLQIELPLEGFYMVAPAILLTLHFYLLAQLRIMAEKLRAFLDAVAEAAGEDVAARDKALKRLDSFVVVQLLTSERFGLTQAPVRLVAWTTLVAAPVLLLLFFQLRFLPYQDVAITWWHRVLVLGDMAVIWWLWPSFIGRPPWTFWYLGVIRWGSALVVVVFSWGLATVPAELWELGGPLAVLRSKLFDGGVDFVTQREASLLSRKLVLSDEEFLTEAQKKAWADATEAARYRLPRTLVLRGRNLRFARLERVDLRKADLTGSNLTGADLDEARLEHATLVFAVMDSASLSEAKLQGANTIPGKDWRFACRVDHWKCLDSTIK